MTIDFSAFGLRPELAQAVAELGYTEPMPIQSEIIPVMLSGRDVIGQAQTGTGKTAAFALPMLNNLQPGLPGVQGLVLAPTRELALQVANAITEMGKHLRVRVLAVYGGAPYGPQIGQLRRGVDIVVGTPGRLMDLMEKKVLDLGTVRRASSRISTRSWLPPPPPARPPSFPPPCRTKSAAWPKSICPTPIQSPSSASR
jgi:ATP-dependent RNA helicase DeaD